MNCGRRHSPGRKHAKQKKSPPVISSRCLYSKNFYKSSVFLNIFSINFKANHFRILSLGHVCCTFSPCTKTWDWSGFSTGYWRIHSQELRIPKCRYFAIWVFAQSALIKGTATNQSDGGPGKSPLTLSSCAIVPEWLFRILERSLFLSLLLCVLSGPQCIVFADPDGFFQTTLPLAAHF